MKAKAIITDSKPLIGAIERYLEFVLADQKAENLVIVDVNTVLDSSQQRQERIGIELAREYIKDPQNIVILISVEHESFLMKNNIHFAGLMTLPNVGFVDALSIKDISEKYQELLSGKRVADKTGLAIYEHEVRERLLAGLRHDKSNIGTASWLKEAREGGLAGTDQEIIAFVKNWSPETSGEFQGKYLEGIFVDALDTLFNQSWESNKYVVIAVSMMSEKLQKKLFVISDSESNVVTKALEASNITWKLISKYTLRGANLEIVIDNLSKEEFESTYKITARQFINVSEL